MRFVNIAHGDLIVLASFILMSFSAILGLASPAASWPKAMQSLYRSPLKSSPATTPGRPELTKRDACWAWRLTKLPTITVRNGGVSVVMSAHGPSLQLLRCSDMSGVEAKGTLERKPRP